MYRHLAKVFLAAFDAWERRRVYAYRRVLEKTQWMTKEDLQRLQLKRLKALLTHAYENVPYYHEILRKVNFRPADFNSVEDLRRIPVLKKSVIRARLNSLVGRTTPRSELIGRATSGTTATPMKLFRGRRDVSWGIAAELRGYGWAGYEVGDKLALLYNVRPSIAESPKFKIENLLGRCKFLNVRSLSEKSMEAFARSLLEFQPDFVRGHCAATNVFAAFLSQNEGHAISPKAAFTSCQTLLPHYRQNIEQAFRCAVYDYYAAAEVSHMAAQCGQHKGLHVFEENIFLEIDADDGPVAPGAEGRVLVTNLHSYAMPFIRYDIGDTGKMFTEPCPCGRELSLFQPMGRTDEFFVNGDGSFTFLMDFQRFFEDIPIRDFQVVQKSYDELVISIVPLPSYTQQHTDFIENNIKYVGQARVRVELVNAISPERSGKTKHFVSKIATKYT